MNTEHNTQATIETETCTRCGGSGRYSYCQMYGDRCFKCHGAGKVYTKRGAATVAFLTAMRSKPARDVRVGDLIRVENFFAGRTSFERVTEVYADKYNANTLCIVTKGMNNGVSPDTMMRMGFTAEEKAEQMKLALAYQATLTKAGTVRKGAR